MEDELNTETEGVARGAAGSFRRPWRTCPLFDVERNWTGHGGPPDEWSISPTRRGELPGAISDLGRTVVYRLGARAMGRAPAGIRSRSGTRPPSSTSPPGDRGGAPGDVALFMPRHELDFGGRIMELLNLPADARSPEDLFSPPCPELEDPPEVAPPLELLLERARRRCTSRRAANLRRANI